MTQIRHIQPALLCVALVAACSAEGLLEPLTPSVALLEFDSRLPGIAFVFTDVNFANPQKCVRLHKLRLIERSGVLPSATPTASST